MNKFVIHLVIFLLASMTLNWSVHSQASSKKKKRQESINFEDELIHGDVKGTDLLYLLRRKQFNYKRLIKLRKDFLPEMRRSAEGVQRGGD